MKRQSLAALRRQAREAADRLEAYAGKIEQGYAFPRVDVTVNTATTHYDGTLKRHTRLAKRINDPMLLPTWQVIPTSEACLEAAALLRRNPDSIGKEPRWTMAGPITAADTVRDARRLYGDRAAEVLRRQIDTIDPDDYHAPTVNRWRRALAILESEQTEP